MCCPASPCPRCWSGGELDARSPLTVASQFEEAIPDAKLVVIPGAGHVSNLEQPEAFNDAVREFCRAHSRRSTDRDGLGHLRPDGRCSSTPGLAISGVLRPPGRQVAVNSLTALGRQCGVHARRWLPSRPRAPRSQASR
jgi:hypothetical protein